MLTVAPPAIFNGPKSDSQGPSLFASSLIFDRVASSIDPDWLIPTEAWKFLRALEVLSPNAPSITPGSNPLDVKKTWTPNVLLYPSWQM